MVRNSKTEERATNMMSINIIGDQSKIAQLCDAIDNDEHYRVVGFRKSQKHKTISTVRLEPKTELAAYMSAAYILKNIARNSGYDIL